MKVAVRKRQFGFIYIVLDKNRKSQIHEHQKTKNATERGGDDEDDINKDGDDNGDSRGSNNWQLLVIMCASCCSKQFMFKDSVPNTAIWQSSRLSIPCLQDPVFPTVVEIVGWLLRLFFLSKIFSVGRL